MASSYKADIFTRLLYRLPGWCIERLPLRFISWVGGLFADAKVSRFFIPLFIRFFSVDTTAFEDTPEVRRTLNTFFCRRIYPHLCRFEPPSEDALLSPAEGYCYSFVLEGGKGKISVKGKSFGLNDFLGCSDFYKEGENVQVTVVYLTPRNYHRFHAPLRCKMSRRFYRISGALLSVNPLALRKFPALYAMNERLVYPLEDGRGRPFQVVAVGATMVGSVVNSLTWRKEGDRLECGDEMGMFKFGGSTIVIVTPEEVELSPSFSSATEIETAVAVSAGEYIGEWKTDAET